MAGSWSHIVDDDGKFIGPQFLDNAGDVQEALLECYGMVWFLADQAARLISQHEDMRAALIPQIIEEARKNYPAGIALSPTGEGH